ncbi:phage tail protein I [Paenibacillus sp. GYB004]|uniref:phage tail protein I n=1 Tax=Paenibacillus sp. GYB004 TaxID=2994393 RepID=UPI002F96A70E
MIDIQTVSLLDMLPPNLRADPNIAAAAQSIDGEIQALNDKIRKLSYFDRMDSLSEEEIEELAWQYHVDFYDPSLPIEQRRELVKNSYAWHKRKGTPSAVEELIATIFGDGEVQEWFQYGGDPYTFRVITSNSSATNEQAQRFIDALNSVKNVRSWLDAVQITAGDEMNLYLGFALHMGEKMTVKQVV